MNETKIKIGKELIPIKFGTWVIQELIESGYELESLGDEIKRNPFKFIPTLLHLGACNAKNMDLSDYNKRLFYDYLDAEGFNSKSVESVINLFTKSFSNTLPSDDEVVVEEKVTKKK